MPIYCYKCYRDENGKRIEDGTGEVHELHFAMGEAPEWIDMHVGGKIPQRCHRDWTAEAAGMTLTVKGSSNKVKRPWPMQPCVASGVHPDQAQELRDHLRERGCPTEVTGGGNPIYTSAAHQKKALKTRGFNNRKSYG